MCIDSRMDKFRYVHIIEYYTKKNEIIKRYV